MIKMKSFRCTISSIENYNKDTRKVLLDLKNEENFKFFAGQYIQILTPQKKFPFSIANAPNYSSHIELHVRPTPGSEDSEIIESIINSSRDLQIEGPLGDCYIQEKPDKPLILIAASTGITQMKSIIEFLEPQGFTKSTYLYWGVVSVEDLYLEKLCKAWDKLNSNFHYIPVVSEPSTSKKWEGRTGLVGKAVLKDFDDLSDIEVYVSGSAGMVYATLDAFLEKGMPKPNMHSDIFSLVPREKKR